MELPKKGWTTRNWEWKSKKKNRTPEVIENGEIFEKFKNYQNKFEHPFSVYLDLEATLEDCENEKHKNAYQKHTENSSSIKFNCIHDNFLSLLKL